MRIRTNILERRAREWANHKSDYCHGLWCWQIPSIKIYYTLTELLSTRTIIRTQSVQSLSHVQLCDSMDCRLSGFPFHHQLPELAHTHVHSVDDAIQPSHFCHPFLLPSIFPNIRVFSNKSGLHIRWRKYWSFSFSISPSNEYSRPFSIIRTTLLLKMCWVNSDCSLTWLC